MNFLSDIITYVRRLIKSPSGSQITDNLIIDYINRFWIMDVDARMQLFDLKTKYQFQTTPGVDQYNMPLYSVQSETPGNSSAQDIGLYPVYQGFFEPAKVNGINVPLYTDRGPFYDMWPMYVQPVSGVAVGNGTAGPYTFTLPFAPNFQSNTNQIVSGLIRGHIDVTGVISYFNTFGNLQDPPIVTDAQINANNAFIQSVPSANVYSAVYITTTGAQGQNIVIADSGQFLADNQNCGLLMQVGGYPNGNLPLINGPAPNYSTTQNVINYNTGVVSNLYFPTTIPAGQFINCQSFWFEPGLPRAIQFYNNTLTLRNPPDQQYLVEIDCYLTPAAFFSTGASIPFAYMAEYIARGAARKILADTGDVDQFMFYEPLFREQEMLVWKRSQRQFTATRTQTIYSSGNILGAGAGNNGSYGSAN